MEKTSSPSLTIIAGPNGSGKTTFYEAIKAKNRKLANAALVNPDVIAKKMANDLNFANVNKLPKELKTHVDTSAARGAILYRDELIKAKKDLVIETTASSVGVLKLIDHAKDNGYKVTVNYLMLQEPQLNISRVEARVKKGDHYVDPETIQRRYYKAKNLIADICIRAGKFKLYDNSSVSPVKLITKYADKVFVHLQKDNQITKFVCSQLKDKGIKVHSLKRDHER